MVKIQNIKGKQITQFLLIYIVEENKEGTSTVRINLEDFTPNTRVHAFAL